MFGVSVDGDVFYALRHSPLGLPSHNVVADRGGGATPFPRRPWPPGVCLHCRPTAEPDDDRWRVTDWPPHCWWLRLWVAGHWRLQTTRLEYAGDLSTGSVFLAFRVTALFTPVGFVGVRDVR